MTPKLAFVGLLAMLFGSAQTRPVERPRPVAVWAAGPLEIRVAFDQPVDSGLVTQMTGRSIQFIEPPGIPDAREGSLKIAAARLVDGGRTLILATDPHPRGALYRLESKELPLKYDLSGVEVSWSNTENGVAWTGWWPKFDLDADILNLAKVSVEHGRGLASLDSPGTLSLRSLVSLPKGKATLEISSSRPFEATLGENPAEAKNEMGTYRARLVAEGIGEPVELSMTLKTSQTPKALSIQTTLKTDGDDASGPLKATQLSLPWVPTPPSASSEDAGMIKLEGGDPKRGLVVFYSEEAKCAVCHKVGGKGGEIGPDLSKIGVHDKAWIYRSIFAPSASIHPDFVSYTVARKSGQVAMGVVKADGPINLKVTDTNAATTIVPRDDVEELRPSASSIMPVGLLGAIGEERTRDLIAYLSSLQAKN